MKDQQLHYEKMLARETVRALEESYRNTLTELNSTATGNRAAISIGPNDGSGGRSRNNNNNNTNNNSSNSHSHSRSNWGGNRTIFSRSADEFVTEPEMNEIEACKLEISGVCRNS